MDTFLGNTQAFLRKNWFVLFTIATYLFFTVYYMGVGTTIADCGNTLSGLGDNSAGPIWKAANAGDQPVGGFSKVTNYPDGESLNSPIDAVVVGQSVLLWATTKIAGPVCGYNVANALGYIASALVMFGFVYSLTKGRRWIALLAGYAVAFTPFFQAKIGGHPSYAFQALLIGIVWAFFSLVTTQKKSRMILLAVLTAFCFYFDPYFSLMAMTILVPLIAAWLVLRFVETRKQPAKKPDFVAKLKALGAATLLFVVLIIPIAYTMVSQSSAIRSATAGTRGNVFLEAKVYSNFPSEYLLPFKDSPFFKVLGSYEQQVKSSWYAFSNGNISEDSVGLSLVMVAVVGLFLIVILWEKLQRRRLEIGKFIRYNPKLVVFGVLAFGLFAFFLALPPAHVFGVPLPSFILLKLTSTWRVLSREYIVVNIAVTLLFVVSLVYFTHALRLKRMAKAVLFGLLFIGIFIQYQTYRPFQGLESAAFSYSNAPAGYHWMKDRSDITSIAEYPIEKATEANSHGYYLSMQLVHKKAILNSAIVDGPGENVRSSLKNLADPQTVPTLHALGISAVSVHGVDPAEIEEIPYLTVVYAGGHGVDAGMPGSQAVTKDVMVVAMIDSNAPVPTASLQFLTTPMLNSKVQTSAVEWQYEVASGAKIGLRRLSPHQKESAIQGKVCFMARMADDGDTAGLRIANAQGGVILETTLTDQYQHIEFASDTDQELTLTNSKTHLVHITDIGCAE